MDEARDGGDELQPLAFGAAPAKGNEVVGERAGDVKGMVVALRPEMGEASAELEEAVGNEEFEMGVAEGRW